MLYNIAIDHVFQVERSDPGMNIAVTVIIEGIGLGLILCLICAWGIRNGAIGLVHLYDQNVKDRVVQMGLTTYEQISKNSLRFRAVCLPGYIIYVIVCVYAINGARGFAPGFLQMYGIIFIMNLIDRLLIDEYWVGHTQGWIIPGTEDLRPYITARDKKRKWLIGIFGWALIAAVLAGIMCLLLK